jgi:hypothetical protein
MFCCLLELASFACGVVLLVRGQMTFTSTRLVQGRPARAIGVLLMLPLVLSQGGELLCGLIWALQQALQNRPPQSLWEMLQELQPILFLIHLAGDGIPLLLALLVAVLYARPAAPPSSEETGSRQRPEHFEDEGETFRPRLWDEDEDWDEDLPPRSGS